MKRLLLIAKIIIFLSLKANGQLWKVRRYEATAEAGTTQFFGDLGGYSNSKNVLGIKDYSFRQTGFNFSAAFRYRLAQDVSVRLNLGTGFFHSTDAGGSNAARGFESTTSFFEPLIIGEYYIINNKRENSYLYLKGKKQIVTSRLPSLDVYIFTGIGGLFYNVSPNAALAAEATGTGGFAAVVPLGVGVRYIYNPRIFLGLEFGARFTSSDNIDGYTSPASNYNDIYQFLGFTVTYRIKTNWREPSSF